MAFNSKAMAGMFKTLREQILPGNFNPRSFEALTFFTGLDPLFYLKCREPGPLAAVGCTHCCSLGKTLPSCGDMVRYVACDGKVHFRKNGSVVEKSNCPKVLLSSVTAGHDNASQEALGRLESAIQVCRPDVLLLDVLISGLKVADVLQVLQNIILELKVLLWSEYRYIQRRFILVAAKSGDPAVLKEQWEKCASLFVHAGSLTHFFTRSSAVFRYHDEMLRRQMKQSKADKEDKAEEAAAPAGVQEPAPAPPELDDEPPKKKKKTESELISMAVGNGVLRCTKMNPRLQESFNALWKRNPNLFVHSLILQERAVAIVKMNGRLPCPLLVEVGGSCSFKNVEVLQGVLPPNPKASADLLCMGREDSVRLVFPEERLGSLGYELETVLLNLVRPASVKASMVSEAVPVPVVSGMILLAAYLCAQR